MISKSYVVGAYHGKLREMARLGVDLTLIVPPEWGGQRLEVGQAAEYKICSLPCFFSGQNHLYVYRPPIGPIEADIVYLEEEPWSLVTHQVLRWCAGQRKPAVFYTWQNIFRRYPPPFEYFERYSYRNAVAAIAGNKEGEDILRRRSFSKPIQVIPQCGVGPCTFFKRDVSSLRVRLSVAGKFAIGYAGRIVEPKGLADLIRALSNLPAGCVLVLLGSGEFEARARQLAAELGVADRIRWVPFVSSLAMPDYMNAFDVLALPSKRTRTWKEQFGRVLVEAMACETPVVGSDSGEIPSVIGQAGLIFREGDVVGLTSCLRNLYESSELRLRLGAMGRARVLERFTERHLAEQTVRFLQQLVDSGFTPLATAPVGCL